MKKEASVCTEESTQRKVVVGVISPVGDGFESHPARWSRKAVINHFSTYQRARCGRNRHSSLNVTGLYYRSNKVRRCQGVGLIRTAILPQKRGSLR